MSAAGSMSDLDKASNTDDVSVSFYSPIYIDVAHLPFFLPIPEALRGRIQLFVQKQRISKKGFCSGLSRLLVSCCANITVCPIRKLLLSEARMYILLNALCRAGFFHRIEEQ